VSLNVLLAPDSIFSLSSAAVYFFELSAKTHEQKPSACATLADGFLDKRRLLHVSMNFWPELFESMLD